MVFPGCFGIKARDRTLGMVMESDLIQGDALDLGDALGERDHGRPSAGRRFGLIIGNNDTNHRGDCMRRPCIECGRPSAGSRCEVHTLPDHRKRAGYGYAWTQLSREIRERFPWCAICGTAGVPLHVDHITPRSLGGTDHPSNLRPLCIPCHRRHGRTRRSKG
ncbi:MAG: HNH endonuclease [Caulobacteraceae bacterium]|nr:HNH endonuclease [Caulobacteraceae bacterium]